MSSECSVGEGSRIIVLYAETNYVYVFSVPRNMTQRNKSINKKLLLAYEKKVLTNAIQNNSE